MSRRVTLPLAPAYPPVPPTHGRLGWGPDKATRPSSIDAVATLVAVSSSKPWSAEP
jgi:hypothetical protein